MSEAPAVPKHASTVLFVRDGTDGLEVYLVRRVKGMPFAGGMTAYPGGSVDPRDMDAHFKWVGPEPAEWAKSFTCDDETARALVAAAVRETFEEAGVLLATEPDGDLVDVSGEEWETERLALIDHSQSFADLLERRGLSLRADLLRPWAHWITPEREPRRFDTRFFLTSLPEGIAPRNVGGEADHAEWVKPGVAVEEGHSGARPMLPPTIQTLEDLSRFSTVQEAMDGAPPRPITPIEPKIINEGDVEYVELPDGTRTRTAIKIGKNRSVAD